MHPPNHHVAAIAIGVGECEPVAATAVDGPYFGQRKDALHESPTIDRKRE